MKIYLVEHSNYDDHCIMGVFSDGRIANLYIEKIAPNCLMSELEVDDPNILEEIKNKTAYEERELRNHQEGYLTYFGRYNADGSFSYQIEEHYYDESFWMLDNYMLGFFHARDLTELKNKMIEAWKSLQ